MAAELGNGLDGGWWPYTASVARELPELIETLQRPLGDIVDICVNWSSLAGVPDLDSLFHRGNAVVPGQDARRVQRIITVTGDRATARLLVVPWRTSTALAVMLLRRAARLPIMADHVHTDAFRIADGIVRAACGQEPVEVHPAGSAPGLTPAPGR